LPVRPSMSVVQHIEVKPILLACSQSQIGICISTSTYPIRLFLHSDRRQTSLVAGNITHRLKTIARPCGTHNMSIEATAHSPFSPCATSQTVKGQLPDATPQYHTSSCSSSRQLVMRTPIEAAGRRTSSMIVVNHENPLHLPAG
jgi:hypothetical protein